MAYSDTRGLSRLNPASVSAALAINTLMLAGFVMLKPDVLPREVWTTLGTYAVDPAKPPEPQPAAEQPTGGATTVSVAPRLPTAQASDNDLVISDPGEISFGDGPGTIVPHDPIKITEPVFKTARLDPRYASAVQPHYPPGLIRQEIEGSVTVRVLVGADGRVKAIEPVKASHEDFLATTRKQALAKWRFLPATRDGEAVESWREMTVTFVMPD